MPPLLLRYAICDIRCFMIDAAIDYVAAFDDTLRAAASLFAYAIDLRCHAADITPLHDTPCYFADMMLLRHMLYADIAAAMLIR